jgi:hypothetical protein
MISLNNPIGKFNYKENYTEEELKNWILDLKNFPEDLDLFIKSLTENELNSKTRLGVWTVTQVVNHLADSHMNAFIRVKLALTEDLPIIKPYDETKFSITKDSISSCNDSIHILKGLHSRWASLFHSLTDDEWDRKYYHPELKKEVKINEVLQSYVWHGKHHLAHIQTVKNI